MSIIKASAITREVGTEKIGDYEYHKTITFYEGFPGMDSTTIYYRLSKDGIYSRENNDPSTREFLEIPFPPMIGNKWSGEFQGVEVDSEITSIEDFVTSKKTYKRSLRITHNGGKNGSEFSMTSYIVPNLGFVKCTVKTKGTVMEQKIKD